MLKKRRIFQSLKDAVHIVADWKHNAIGNQRCRSAGISNCPAGANMAIFRVDHPDIVDFINCKRVEGRIRNFNISVGITDEFMETVINRPNDLWLTTWNGEKMKPHKVLRAKNGAVTGFEEVDITAKELFDLIIDSAWTNGEPGTFFIDAANRANPLPRFSDIKATNPCGEQPLGAYDVCNLGSINLASFTDSDKINWNRLAFVTRTAIRMLDNVIDRSNFPVPKVTETMKGNRRIGLGIMGSANSSDIASLSFWIKAITFSAKAKPSGELYLTFN